MVSSKWDSKQLEERPGSEREGKTKGYDAFQFDNFFTMFRKQIKL